MQDRTTEHEADLGVLLCDNSPRQLGEEILRLRAALRSFFDTPLPSGKYQHPGGVCVVTLKAMHGLRTAMEASDAG